jgi:hypothetical protein
VVRTSSDPDDLLTTLTTHVNSPVDRQRAFHFP